MHEFRVEKKSRTETISDMDVGSEPVKPRRPTLSYGCGPQRTTLSRVVRRTASGMLAHAPAGLRHRLYGVLNKFHPAMGRIERDYQKWIDQFDRIGIDDRRAIVTAIARLSQPARISILMPVFNPSPQYLLAAINSVRNQLYPWWELCIGDDASTDPAVIAILREAAETDHRIKVVRRERNGHISAASNSALRLATGLFVALMDHDDVLPPNALYEVAAKIAARPDIDVIYSDEDHIDDDGRRSHPYFKPGWNPELILGQNLISHMGVYRRALVEQVGGFRTGFEGSQDHDLALRVVAETHADRIAHIPKVLYHWRQRANAPTFSEAAHERCVMNSRRAIHELVMRQQPNAVVEPAPVVSLWTRVIYPVPVPAPLVSVIVSCDCPAAQLFDCIDGLLNRTDYPALEVLLPSAAPALPDASAENRRVRVTPSGRKAADMARGSLLLLLDPGLEPMDAGWLREMVSHGLRPDVGAVGAKLVAPSGSVLHAGFVVGGRGVAVSPFVGYPEGRSGYFGFLHLSRDVTAVSGRCLLVRRQAFLEVGGLDDMLGTFGDVDLCLKLAEAGYRILWTPHAELSQRSALPRLDAARSSQAAGRLRARWGEKLNYDRYWSPNLSIDGSGLRLAFPPHQPTDSMTPPSTPAVKTGGGSALPSTALRPQPVAL